MKIDNCKRLLDAQKQTCFLLFVQVASANKSIIEEVAFLSYENPPFFGSPAAGAVDSSVSDAVGLPAVAPSLGEDFRDQAEKEIRSDVSGPQILALMYHQLVVKNGTDGPPVASKHLR